MISTTGKLKETRNQSAETRKSFTLMEMLVVLAVIVLIIGLSIPFFSSFSKGTKLKTAARDVSSVLNTARNLAITYRKDYAVVFDLSGSTNSFYIVDEEGRVYEKKYSLPTAIRFSHPANPDLPTTFPAHRATFSSTGGLRGNSGSAWVADNKGDFRRITVSNTTGRIKIDKEP